MMDCSVLASLSYILHTPSPSLRPQIMVHVYIYTLCACFNILMYIYIYAYPGKDFSRRIWAYNDLIRYEKTQQQHHLHSLSSPLAKSFQTNHKRRNQRELARAISRRHIRASAARFRSPSPHSYHPSDSDASQSSRYRAQTKESETSEGSESLASMGFLSPTGQYSRRHPPLSDLKQAKQELKILEKQVSKYIVKKLSPARSARSTPRRDRSPAHDRDRPQPGYEEEEDRARRSQRDMGDEESLSSLHSVPLLSPWLAEGSTRARRSSRTHSRATSRDRENTSSIHVHVPNQSLTRISERSSPSHLDIHSHELASYRDHKHRDSFDEEYRDDLESKEPSTPRPQRHLKTRSTRTTGERDGRRNIRQSDRRNLLSRSC